MKEKKPTTPLKAFLEKLLFAFYVVALVVAICFSTFVWYQKTYFVTYWVHGQSMWPTLNSEVINANGEKINNVPNAMNGAKNVDFIIGDDHDRVIDKLERFDIIICKYTDEDTFDKIKRVIALPGETFFIDSTGKNQENNGRLHVLNNYSGEFEVIEQPLEDKYVIVGEYPATYAKPYTLGDDEYFVMGDNRPNSSDSRTNGPVKRANIEAKAVALVARCSIVTNPETRKLEPTDIQYMWPRFL